MKVNKILRLLVVSMVTVSNSFATEISTPSSSKKTQRKIASKGIISTNKKKEIVIAATVPLSGNLYKIGKEWVNAMSMVFNEQNRAKGVHGYTIKLDARDDKYDPYEMRKNIKSLLKKTDLFIGTFGSDVIDIFTQDIKNDYLVFFPNAGAKRFRDSEYSKVFFFRPPTGREVEALIWYATHELKKNRIAIFYEDSLWGVDGFNQGMEYLKKIAETDEKEVACVSSASYGRNSVNVKRAVKEIAKQNPDAVICISQYRATFGFIKGILNDEQQRPVFLGVSESAIVQDYLQKSRGISLIVSSVVPNPLGGKFPIATEYAAAMKKNYPNDKLSLISLESFINASLFVDRLEKIEPPITKEKIVSSIEALQDYEFKGLRLSFNPETRTISNSVWINPGRGQDWLEYRE